MSDFELLSEVGSENMSIEFVNGDSMNIDKIIKESSKFILVEDQNNIGQNIAISKSNILKVSYSG